RHHVDAPQPPRDPDALRHVLGLARPPGEAVLPEARGASRSGDARARRDASGTAARAAPSEVASSATATCPAAVPAPRTAAPGVGPCPWARSARTRRAPRRRAEPRRPTG